MTGSRSYPPAGSLFRRGPAQNPGRLKLAEKWLNAHPKAFVSTADVLQFLDHVTMPASRRWSYARNPKTGTNTLLAALFQIEFGAPLTVKVADPGNASEDTATRYLNDGGVLMDVSRSYGEPDVLSHGLRITTVREPMDRALSSFAYLQQSHETQSRQFARLRIRLNASYRFDWDRHPGTAEGFERFLDFVGDLSGTPKFPIDRHIMPQCISVRPDFFKPARIGRTDNLGPFIAALSEELGCPQADVSVGQRQNAGMFRKVSFDVTDHARRRCEDIYAADYDLYESASGS